VDLWIYVITVFQRFFHVHVFYLPYGIWPIHCKKGLRISRPQPGCLQARSKLLLFKMFIGSKTFYIIFFVAHHSTRTNLRYYDIFKIRIRRIEIIIEKGICRNDPLWVGIIFWVTTVNIRHMISRKKSTIRKDFKCNVHQGRPLPRPQ
jgi:hypothetical protein